MAYTQPIPDVPMLYGLLRIPTTDSSLGFTDYSNLDAIIADLEEDHDFIMPYRGGQVHLTVIFSSSPSILVWKKHRYLVAMVEAVKNFMSYLDLGPRLKMFTV